MRASWPTFPRVDLVGGPTPLHPTPRLSAALGGPDIWFKRDDLTALALGGNKLRKLELLLADAQAQGAEVVVTAGAAQSNHCVQTAAACRVLGLECVVVLRGGPDTPVVGNVLLDHLFGADVRMRDMDMDERNEAAEEVAAELRAAGRRVVVIPVGGSNALGVIGYAHAAFELHDQARASGFTPVSVVCASGSGGTQAGLTLGALALGAPFTVHGVSVRADAPTLTARVASLASAGADRVGEPPVDPSAVLVHDAYVGPGYGELTAGSLEAIRLAARTEGLVVDPVYTGKALSGLIGEVRAGRWSAGEHVVFVHTGGSAAVFAYNERLLQGAAP